MKKFLLFAAAMTFCAGIAFAQQPVKKATANTAATPTKEVKATQKQHCGKCPNHAQANKEAVAATKDKEVKNAQNNATKCCNKEKACNKEKSCNKSCDNANNANKAATKK